MTENLLGGFFMALGLLGWWAIVRRTGDTLHPLGVMLLIWLLVFGFGHWDVPVTYDEPYYALPFELQTYAVVLSSLVVFSVGYWLIDPDLPRLDSGALAARLRAGVRVGPLRVLTLALFLMASATTVYFYRIVGEIPLFSPRVDELRQAWKLPLIGYVYDLHYVVALFGTILVDRARSARERVFWVGLVLASIIQLAFGAVRMSPLTGVVWAAVYIFYRRAGRVRLRHLALLGLVVFGLSSVTEHYRRTPLRLNPELANPRLDLSLSATVWGHTGASFKNLQLSLDKHVPFLGLGTTSYGVAKTLDPTLQARDREISYRYDVHNTTTYLLPLYMDFGWFGLLVMPGVYGALTALVYRRFRDQAGLFWLIVYIDFLIAVVLAFRTHKLLGNTLLCFSAVGWVAHMLVGRSGDQPAESADLAGEWSGTPAPEGVPAAWKGVVLYGASELGRDVAAMGPALLDAWHGPHHLHGFLDDRAALHGTTILDLPVLGGTEWLDSEEASGMRVVVTIGDPAVRRKVVERLEANAARFATLVHPTVEMTPWVQLGEGTVVLARCTFTADIRVGRHVALNPGCTVAHDVVIEDYVYVSPGVDLAGKVMLGEACHLGTGAIVIPGRRVGARATVGAGAVVVNDIPPDVTAVGVPARVRTPHNEEPRA